MGEHRLIAFKQEAMLQQQAWGSLQSLFVAGPLSI
jgi:hypothetical protein